MNERKYCLKAFRNNFFLKKRTFVCRSTKINTSVFFAAVEGAPILYVTDAVFKI
jgi:hypothetical protein